MLCWEINDIVREEIMHKTCCCITLCVCVVTVLSFSFGPCLKYQVDIPPFRVVIYIRAIFIYRRHSVEEESGTTQGVDCNFTPLAKILGERKSGNCLVGFIQ